VAIGEAKRAFVRAKKQPASAAKSDFQTSTMVIQLLYTQALAWLAVPYVPTILLWYVLPSITLWKEPRRSTLRIEPNSLQLSALPDLPQDAVYVVPEFQMGVLGALSVHEKAAAHLRDQTGNGIHRQLLRALSGHRVAKPVLLPVQVHLRYSFG